MIDLLLRHYASAYDDVVVTCWASGIGGCSGRQSGEHYFTGGLWSNSSITISGFDWQKGEAKLLPVGSLEANILCTTHNNKLGEKVDAEAIRVFKIMGEISQAFQDWEVKPPKKKAPLPKRYAAGGKLLERWAAKTLVDVVCVEGQKETKWHDTNSPAIEPPIEVVRSIYDEPAFKHPMGLYLVQESTNTSHAVLEEAIRVDPRFHPDDGGLMGGFIEFRNLRFLIWLSSKPFEGFLTEARSGATFGEGGNPVVYHLDELKFNFNYVTRHKILINW